MDKKTLLFSEPARSTSFILPVNATQMVSPTSMSQNIFLLVFATGSTIVTSMVRIACERDEARFRFVDPTDRCLFAMLGEKRSVNKTPCVCCN